MSNGHPGKLDLTGVSYDPGTGSFTKFNKQRGHTALLTGHLTPSGYLRVLIGSRTAYLHVVAFAVQNGRLPHPNMRIVHVDRDRTNNKWDNLREVERYPKIRGIKEKRCASCKQIRSASEFGAKFTSPDGKHARCRLCRKRDAVDLRIRRKLSGYRPSPKAVKNNKLKQAFGISYEQYFQMRIAQSDLCKICFRPETMVDHRTGKVRQLAVDHDHGTGQIRGLLCSRCNTAIGLLRNDSILCKSAEEYLWKAMVSSVDGLVKDGQWLSAPCR